MRNYKLIYANHAKGIFSRYSHGVFAIFALLINSGTE